MSLKIIYIHKILSESECMLSLILQSVDWQFYHSNIKKRYVDVICENARRHKKQSSYALHSELEIWTDSFGRWLKQKSFHRH